MEDPAGTALIMFAHAFPFDPSYGHTLASLRQVPPAPAPEDFAAFWRETWAEAAAVVTRPQFTPSAQRVEGFEILDVAYTSLGGVRIGGWMALPRDRPIRRGIVISHGYGGRDGPDTAPLQADAAMIFPCARGLSASRQAGIPDVSTAHVLHGIESRETYVHRGCVADIWLAATVLIARAPAAARDLAYVGASFGGGIGALALPWDERFTRGFLAVPSFGQHPIRLTLPCVGSGEAVRDYARTHPEVADVLRYFDASVAAQRISIPMLVAAAQFDPAVPPPGQFAVYNALPGPKELLPLEAGHFDWPGAAAEDARQRAALIRFLSVPGP